MSHLSFISRLELPPTRGNARKKKDSCRAAYARLTSRLVTSPFFVNLLESRYFSWLKKKKKIDEVAALNFHRSKVRYRRSKKISRRHLLTLLTPGYCCVTVERERIITGRVSAIPLHRKSTVVESVIRGVAATCAPVRVK